MFPSREQMLKVIGTHGRRERESDGRLSGTIITVKSPRRDGKFPVVYTFGEGKWLNKLYSFEQVQKAIESVTKRD